MQSLLKAIALLTFAQCSAVPAQAPPTAADGAIEQLKPGEYLWAPNIAPAGPVTIVISLATQRAYAYRNGAPIGVSTASTGAPGHETPTGVFVILQKAVKHKSNIYSDAPTRSIQGFLIEISDVFAVKQDLPTVGLLLPANQPQHGGFAAARRTHECGDFAARNGQRDLVEDDAVTAGPRIREGDVLEFDQGGGF